MATTPTREIDDIVDIMPGELILSARKVNKWDSGEQTYAELYHKQHGSKLIVNLEDVRTINGIKIIPKFKSGLMSINVTDEQSKLVREKLDDPILQMCFERRGEFLRKGLPVTKASDLRIMYRGIVQDGDQRSDGSGKYDDQITSTIPTKKRQQQVEVDESACCIEDLEGNRLPPSALERVKIKELALEVQKIVFAKDGCISVRTRMLMIVADTSVAPRIMTKRKLAMSMNLPISMSPPVETKRQKTCEIAAPSQPVSTPACEPVESSVAVEVEVV